MINFSNKWRKILDVAIRCFYPKYCPVCNKIIPINEDYCKCSRKSSKKIGDNICYHCGYDEGRCICSARNSMPLPKVTGVYIYSGKIRADILNLKFNNEKHLAIKLGTDMAERCANIFFDIDFDIVTYVPMSKRSFDKRGYNQSQLLAEQVGKMMFVPVEDIFVKTRETLTQFTLNGNERVQNVKNSVEVKKDACVTGKRILICDDVKTTGSTLNQCVKALEKSGAAEICCICIALSDFHA